MSKLKYISVYLRSASSSQFSKIKYDIIDLPERKKRNNSNGDDSNALVKIRQKNLNRIKHKLQGGMSIGRKI